MHEENINTILREIIDGNEYTFQADILKELKKQGVAVTQATLSRNLKKLGAVKQAGVYKIGPVGYALDGFSKVISMKFVEPNVIIIKTSSGLAQSAAALIDSSFIEGLEGTVAGDDTIICIITPPSRHAKILKNLSELFTRARSRS